ncbi:hypothetical protein DR92_3421 [Brucella anthropi]|nr:hypothetical protein DR92_3421 [Brucella anthropi]
MNCETIEMAGNSLRFDEPKFLRIEPREEANGMEFPRDIEDAARNLWLEVSETNEKVAPIDIIALAILRERQRCATIALCVFDDEEWSDEYRMAGGLAADAILAGNSNISD